MMMKPRDHLIVLVRKVSFGLSWGSYDVLQMKWTLFLGAPSERNVNYGCLGWFKKLLTNVCGM